MAQPSSKAMWRSSERLYTDKDGKVVKANDPSKLTLLVAENGEIPIARARELGLVQIAPATDTVPPSVEGEAPIVTGEANQAQTVTEFNVEGISGKVVDGLKAANLYSKDALSAASDEDLMKIEGVGEATLKAIRASLDK